MFFGLYYNLATNILLLKYKKFYAGRLIFITVKYSEKRLAIFNLSTLKISTNVVFLYFLHVKYFI